MQAPGGDDASLAATLARLEGRLAAIEEALGGGQGQAFIGPELRPDLVGGPQYPAAGSDLQQRMAMGDPTAQVGVRPPPRRVTAVRHPAVVVLAPSHDRGAVAVARAAAARRSAGAVQLVTPSALAGARGWTHAIDAQGAVTGDVVLRSGTVLAPDAIGCVLNRCFDVTAPAFARAQPRERDYAAAEMHALVVSWLAGLGRPVINRAETMLGSTSRRQWLMRAIAAGIPVVRDVVATSASLVPRELRDRVTIRGPWPDTRLVARQPVEAGDAVVPPFVDVLVAGDRIHGKLPASLARRCVELARGAGYALLQLSFAARGAQLRLAYVDPMPSLLDRIAVDAVADLLERSVASPA